MRHLCFNWIDAVIAAGSILMQIQWIPINTSFLTLWLHLIYVNCCAVHNYIEDSRKYGRKVEMKLMKTLLALALEKANQTEWNWINITFLIVSRPRWWWMFRWFGKIDTRQILSLSSVEIISINYLKSAYWISKMKTKTKTTKMWIRKTKSKLKIGEQ